MRPRIYIASPLGFAEPTRLFYDEVLLPAVQNLGLEPADPWAGGTAISDALKVRDPAERVDALRHANHSIGETNEWLIESSQGVLAVLDGPDVDSGTAAEIGWAAAKGLPVVGWRSDIRRSGDNEAALVNLQVEYSGVSCQTSDGNSLRLTLLNSVTAQEQLEFWLLKS